MSNIKKSIQTNSGLNIKTWSTLKSKRHKPVKFIVDDLLPPGVTILAGRPKQGKSWLAHAMLLKIAAGKKIFGKKTNRCETLYMALEDSERRLQQRTRKLMRSYGITHKDINNRFHVSTDAGILGRELGEQLTELLTNNSKIKFVVIDVLARIRQPRKAGQSVYDYDYETGKLLKDIAKYHPDVAFLIIHHVNKGDGDSLESVSGSYGLTGGVDNALVMMNSGDGVEIHINGRDIEDSSPITLSKSNDGMWTLENSTTALFQSNSGTRNKILKAIQNGHTAPKDIISATGLDKGTVTQQLLRMANSGILIKQGRGNYAIPTKPTNTP